MLKPHELLRGALALDGRPDERAPFGPGAVVVAHVGLVEEFGEDKPGVRAALTDAAVRDDVVARGQALLALIDGPQLLHAAEGAVVVRRPPPRHQRQYKARRRCGSHAATFPKSTAYLAPAGR